MRTLHFLLALLLLASTASAAEFVVTKTADTADGSCDATDCSLREAVIAANGQAGDDVITLPAGLYVLSHAGSGEDAAATGDLDVTDNLTVNGEGAAATAIHGGGGFLADPDRLFNVFGTANLSLSGLTLRNGTPPAGSGGAVAVTGTGNLIVDSCDFISNAAGLNSSGGAISHSGPGSSPSPTLQITNSRILNNVATRQGGGVIALKTAVSIQKSEISGNQTGLNGGGILVNESDTTLSDCLIQDNIAGDAGGGFSNILGAPDGTTISISNTTVSGNRANIGGGVAKNGGTFTLTGVTIEDNQSHAVGGGIAYQGDAFQLGGDSVVRGNVSGDNGGGVLLGGLGLSSNAEIKDTIIEENSSTGAYGGGIYVLDDSLKLDAAEVRNNFAERGGGALLTGSAQAEISKTTFDGNGAGTFGGGLYDEANAPLSIKTSTFSNNASPLGGGLVFLSADILSIENSTFSANSGSAVANTGDATISNSTFFGNTFTLPGAALVGTGPVTIQNSALISDGQVNCQHPVSSGGHNLDADGSCGLAASGDQSADPRLGPLNDNGGLTKTHAPLPGSPAIDGGDNALCLSEDQRGVSRPLDGNVDGTAACDIGAIEITACGDGVVQEGEECDDGNAVDDDVCNADCTLPSSGGTTGGTSGDTTGGTAGTGGGTGSAEDASGGCSLMR